MCAELRPEMGMHLLHFADRRGSAGADRPDRFVGDHRVLAGRAPRDARCELRADDGKRLPVVPLLRSLADADDRSEAGPSRGFGLRPHRLARFAVVGATFGMSENNVAASRVLPTPPPQTPGIRK